MSRVLKKSSVEPTYKNIANYADNNLIEFFMIFEKKPDRVQLNTLGKILRQYNLELKHTNNTFARVCGRVENINIIFKTRIGLFKKDGEKKFYSTTENIIIPYDLYFVKDVIGLNNFKKFKPHYVLRPPKINNEIILDEEDYKEVYQTEFTPPEIARLYDFPIVTWGTKQNIAIIALGGGYIQTDLDYYFKVFLKLENTPMIIPVSVQGGKNDPSDIPGTFETVLDIEVAGAIASCSNIIVYFAPNTELGFYDAVYTAINNQYYKPDVISISWGTPEIYNNPSYVESINELFGEAVKKKINIFVSSGDEGSKDGTNQLTVDFPAGCPNCIACGGTTITVIDGKLVSEITWSGSGGGYSNIFSKPEYQNIAGQKRGVPDCAGSSDPNRGYITYLFGKFEVQGGTSAVAPLYAGLTTLFNQAKYNVPFLNTVLYPKREEVCYDIIVGSNGPDGKYDAKVGWDPCTGNGRIYGKILMDNL